MYGRTTIIDGRPERLDAVIAFSRDTVAPTVDTMPGCLGISVWVNRETGRSVALTGWQDEMSRSAAAEQIAALRSEACAIMGGDARTESWELAVMHQVTPDKPGYVTRMVSMSGDPATVDRGIELFRSQVVPRVSTMSGFNTISLAVNRANGRAQVATTYTSRSAAETARHAAAQIRDTVASQLGLTVDEVDELELVHVGIRGPNDAPERTIVELPTETSV